MATRAIGRSRSAPRDRRRSGDAVPRVLCWNCRKLTAFEVERCEHCGAAFAGSTGGAYGSNAFAFRSMSTSREATPRSSRSLAEMMRDLQSVREVTEPRASRLPDGRATVQLFQCPACGRAVSEEATSCSCGVRFAASTSALSACPECGSLVPVMDDACPVCGVEFEPGAESVAYACPRCGAHVAMDAVQCSCGAWFED